MTPEELAEIEERCAKATPGPWTFNPLVAVESPSREVIGIDWTTADTADLSLRDCDGAFIAHARSDVPALCAEVRRLREDRAEATAADRREYAAMILRDYRGVEDPCPVCDGWGIQAYASTATWRGGIGGQAITTGVCDRCWGSGDRNRPGVDLRAAEAETRRLREALDAAQRIVKRKADREAGREET